MSGSSTGTPSLYVDTSFKGIILLTIPISLAKLIPELNYLLNASFLGHLGKIELAMTGITGIYYLIFAAMGYGVHNALLAIMSRMAGENKSQGILPALSHGFLFTAILAILSICFTWYFSAMLFQWLGVEEQGSMMATSFLDIRIVGLVFLFGLQMGYALLITLQKTKYLIYIALIESIVNIVLDYSMIFGHFGFRVLGFNGAAYASIISEAVGFTAICFIIYKSRILEKYGLRFDFSFDIHLFKTVIKQSIPLMAQLTISIVAWWGFYILVNRNYTYNDQALSQVMRNIFGLTGVFSWAFGSSTNTIVSNLIGQGRVHEIYRIIIKLCTVSLIGMLSIALALYYFTDPFLTIFGQSDLAFFDTGHEVVSVVSIAILILCVGVIWLNAVVATGNSKVVFWIELISIISYSVYVYYCIEVYRQDLHIAWMSEWLYWSIMIVFSIGYMYWGSWEKTLGYAMRSQTPK